MLPTAGVVTSPNYPDNYPNNLERTDTIQVGEGLIISLQFSAFDIESHSSCDYDVLEVREGGLATGPLVGRFCGHDTPPSYLSSTNSLYFNFRSDYSVSHAGFRIRYKTGE